MPADSHHLPGAQGDGTFFHFGYGSNMCTGRLREPDRAPSAVPLWVCRAPDRALRWDKSSRDRSGKAHIVHEPGAVVWGVVFRISETDREPLDEREGLGRGYTQVEITVLRRDGTPVKAQTYLAQEGALTELLPFDWYKDFVLRGATQHGLPPDYIAEAIEPQQVQIDPNAERRSRNLSRTCVVAGVASAV